MPGKGTSLQESRVGVCLAQRSLKHSLSLDEARLRDILGFLPLPSAAWEPPVLLRRAARGQAGEAFR
jgi:hypothetical protein